MIDSVSLGFEEAIKVQKDKKIKVQFNIEKEELFIQKAYEKYSLGKIDREFYSLKREIALSHIETINNEMIAIDKVVKDFEKEKRKSLKWIKDIFAA